MDIQSIYLNAENRQTKLVFLAFDLCIQISLFELMKTTNNLMDPRIRALFKTNVEKIILPSTNLLENVKFLLTSDYIINSKDLVSRQEISKFISDHSESFPIKVIDGNVKSRERTIEKANDLFGGDISKIKDINRITIISDHLKLINEFMLLSEQHNTIFKKDWEYKAIGTLSRTGIVTIDGFPTEVHLAETTQFLSANVFPHKLYEVYRLKTETEEEISTFKKQLFAVISLFNKDKNLRTKIEEFLLPSVSCETIDIKTVKKCLLHIHRKLISETFFSAKKEWQVLYLTKLIEYNRKANILDRSNENIFSKEIQLEARKGLVKLNTKTI